MDSKQRELVGASLPCLPAFRALPRPRPPFPAIIISRIMRGMPSDWHCGHTIPLTIKGRRVLVCYI